MRFGDVRNSTEKTCNELSNILVALTIWTLLPISLVFNSFVVSASCKTIVQMRIFDDDCLEFAE